MLTSMLGIAYRLSVANRSRMIASIASVAVAMSLIVSMSLLLSNMERSYKQQLADVFGDVDIIVTPPKHSDNQIVYFDQREQQLIAEANGVKQSSFILLNPIEGEELFLIGLQNDELAKVRYKYTEDLLDDEVVITDSLAQRLGAVQGEIINLPLNHIERKEWKLKEIIEDVNVTSFPDLVYMNITTLQKLSGLGNFSSGVMLDIDDNVEALSLVRLLERTIQAPVAYQLVKDSDLAKKNTESMRWISSVVTIATLLASLAIVLSNFRLMLQSILHPLIVLHTNGAKKRGLFSIILYQLAGVVGLGTILGGLTAAVFSVSGAALLERIFSIQHAQVTFSWRHILLSMFIYGVVLFILLLPLLARGFSKLPLEFRNTIKSKERGISKARKYVACLLLFFSIALIIPPLYFYGSVILYPVAGVMFACAIWLSMPIMFQHWLNFRINQGLRKKQKEKMIAMQYLSIYFKQNVLIILAISISINVPVIGFTVLHSAKEANIQIFNEEFVADIHMYNNSITVALPENVVSEVTNIKGVQAVIPVSQDDWATVINTKALSEDERYHNLYYKKSDLRQLVNKGLLPTLPNDLSNVVVLTSDYAKELGVTVGDELLLRDPEQEDLPRGNLLIAAIVDGYMPGSMSINTLAYVDAEQSIVGADKESLVGSRAREWNTLLLYIDEEQRTAIYEELHAYASFYTSIRYSDKQLALSSMEEFAHQRFIFLYAIVAVTLLVSAIGIYYTMHAFVNGRRREFAVLFSLGMNFRQLRTMLVLQLCWFCLIAGITGITTSLAISSTLLLAMESPLIAVPWAFIGSIIFGMLSFGYGLALVLAQTLRDKSIPQLMKAD
ncbi:MAG: ABC transporter permease [Candidatus Pristimantibacillus lignocellulolyticus]|uniref:ABC transporter permease n=1 Tax=Candidatus Pristimantibacillus lignocellulolyticus TaxID=2994561 RepID=A0A9J6Z9L8_9BACL|nr:MAG: ABC transporter permease [Candidatus Pristimantibacillus lignocellulolyticus]